MFPVRPISKLHQKAWILPAVVLGLQLQLVVVHMQNLWNDLRFRFFPLVLVAPVLFARRRYATGADTRTDSYLRSRVAFLMATLCVFETAMCLGSPWLRTAGAS